MFRPSQIASKNLLEIFLNHKISDYSKLRNFSYDIENTIKNVSGLSPYISRGLLKEEYVLKKVINSNKKRDKFIQEIFWRVYWQGWLESHKGVWEKYKDQIKNIENSKQTENENFKLALSAETSIKPFNDWVNILKSSGYLHNHVRMWFASIWIFYLGLPWQLGAKFFYENLLDGDVASNLLSWRWVAGLQTKGKRYIATEENINKYTFERYKKFKLPQIKDIVLDFEENKKSIIEYKKLDKSFEGCALIITDNNLNYNLLKKLKENIKVLVLLKFNLSSVKKSQLVLDFQKKIYEEFVTKCRSGKHDLFEVEVPSEINKLNEIFKKYEIENVFYDYLRCGYEKDIMIKTISELKNKINFYDILDNFYIESWKYCQKGFFKFKEKIPLLLNNLN